MKIKKHTSYIEEPFACLGCEEDYNARHHLKLELIKGLIIEIELCDKCYDKLNSTIA